MNIKYGVKGQNYVETKVKSELSITVLANKGYILILVWPLLS